MRSISAFAAGLAVAAAVSGGAVTASATEFKLTAGSSHPPILPWVQVIKEHVVPESNRMLKELGINHTIKWTEAYAGALYNFNNTLEGVGDGLADIGWVGTLWEPAKMPLHNVTYYAPFVTGDVHALMEIQEQMEESIPAFRNEWTKNNTVFLGAQVADTYHIVSKVPINKFEDLKGKKFLTAGAVAAWLTGTGATAVNAGLPIFYNSIKTGVADGAVILTTGILPFKLHEVAPYIIKVDMGAVISGALAINRDTWNKLPPEMKVLLRMLGREYAQKQTDMVAARAKAAFAILEKQGAKISELPQAERAKWVNALPNIAGDWVKRNGPAAKVVLKTLMDGVRKRGGHPVRDWDKDM